MNVSLITGRMGRDPVPFAYGEGSEGCRFSIAVDNPRRDEPDWFQVTAFGQSAEFALNYLHKGDQVAAHGRISLGEWEKDGETRYSLDLVANRVEALSSRRDREEQPREEKPEQASAEPEIDWTIDEDEDPFADE